MLPIGLLAVGIAEREAGRELVDFFALAPREAFDETMLRFFVDALRETAALLAGAFPRELAAADRFFVLLRAADAARDFDAELRAATFDFDELRRALALRVLALREEPDREAEAFFDFEATRPRLFDPLDELPERPEDLEVPRLLDAITTPFDVSALQERIDR